MKYSSKFTYQYVNKYVLNTFWGGHRSKIQGQTEKQK